MENNHSDPKRIHAATSYEQDPFKLVYRGLQSSKEDGRTNERKEDGAGHDNTLRSEGKNSTLYWTDNYSGNRQKSPQND